MQWCQDITIYICFVGDVAPVAVGAVELSSPIFAEEIEENAARVQAARDDLTWEGALVSVEPPRKNRDAPSIGTIVAKYSVEPGSESLQPRKP